VTRRFRPMPRDRRLNHENGCNGDIGVPGRRARQKGCGTFDVCPEELAAKHGLTQGDPPPSYACKELGMLNEYKMPAPFPKEYEIVSGVIIQPLAIRCVVSVMAACWLREVVEA
jgi:hypothetical protein